MFFMDKIMAIAASILKDCDFEEVSPLIFTSHKTHRYINRHRRGGLVSRDWKCAAL